MSANFHEVAIIVRLLGATGQDTSVAEAERRFGPSYRGKQNTEVTI